MSETAQPISLRDLGYADPEEIAKLLSVETQTLANWRSRRIGPPFTKLNGKRVVYPIKAAEKWLAGRTVRMGAAPTMTQGKARSRRRA